MEEIKTIRPGDPGFDEAAATCRPPKVKREDTPRPTFVEYRKGKAVEG